MWLVVWFGDRRTVKLLQHMISGVLAWCVQPVKKLNWSRKFLKLSNMKLLPNSKRYSNECALASLVLYMRVCLRIDFDLFWIFRSVWKLIAAVEMFDFGVMNGKMTIIFVFCSQNVAITQMYWSVLCVCIVSTKFLKFFGVARMSAQGVLCVRVSVSGKRESTKKKKPFSRRRCIFLSLFYWFRFTRTPASSRSKQETSQKQLKHKNIGGFDRSLKKGIEI